MRVQILKVVAYVLIAMILVHWLTAGNDETLEGPLPEAPSHQVHP